MLSRSTDLYALTGRKRPDRSLKKEQLILSSLMGKKKIRKRNWMKNLLRRTARPPILQTRRKRNLRQIPKHRNRKAILGIQLQTQARRLIPVHRILPLILRQHRLQMRGIHRMFRKIIPQILLMRDLESMEMQNPNQSILRWRPMRIKQPLRPRIKLNQLPRIRLLH